MNFMPVFYIQFTLMNRNVALCDELQQLVSRGDDYLYRSQKLA